MKSVVLLSLLLWMLLCSRQLRAQQSFDWSVVKPMYLVSLYPNPLTDTERVAEADDLPAMLMNMEPSLDDGELLTAYNNGKINSRDSADITKEAMDRIFGGVEVPTHCFPYQVGLLLQRPKGLYWCGGSLISDEYVLTAAHCVDMAKRGLVFLGANEIKNAKEKGQIRIIVHRSNFIIFPTWNPRRLKDDIALVRLPESIDFTDRIYPIQLPKRSYEYRSFKNKLAIASGWGRYSTGVRAISGVLRSVKLQIIDGKTCKRTFPLSYRGTNICTSGHQSKSTCSGDSGGPLVLRRRNTKRRVLVGITSFGSIHGCDRGFPAAFTKVASYLDWISDETGIAPLQETTNAIFYRQYLQDYYNKQRHKQNSDYTDEASISESFTNNQQHNSYHPDAKILQTKYNQKTNQYQSNLDYNLFIL